MTFATMLIPVQCLDLLLQHQSVSDYSEILHNESGSGSGSGSSSGSGLNCTCIADSSSNNRSFNPQSGIHDKSKSAVPFYLHPPSGFVAGSFEPEPEPFFLHDRESLVFDRIRQLLFGRQVNWSESSQSESHSECSPNECCAFCSSPEGEEEIHPIPRHIAGSPDYSEIPVNLEPRNHSYKNLEPQESEPGNLEPQNLDSSDPEPEYAYLQYPVSGNRPRILESENLGSENCGSEKPGDNMESVFIPDNIYNIPNPLWSSNRRMAPPPPPLPPESESENSQSLNEMGCSRMDRSMASIEIEERHKNLANLPKFLMNQKILPFIPPRFPSPCDSDSLIKPSEYLKSIHSNGNSLDSSLVLDKTTSSGQASSSRLTTSEENEVVHGEALDLDLRNRTQDSRFFEKNLECSSGIVSPTGSASVLSKSQQTNGKQSTGLTYTLTMQKSGWTAEPPQVVVAQSSLIAELKASRDINGIKKLKDEKAKEELELEKQEAEEFKKQFSPENFITKIPETDANGQLIPPWKRQVLARKVAEKAKKEAEEERKQKLEERRLQAVPAWKRQLHIKKETHSKSPSPETVLWTAENESPTSKSREVSTSPWKVQLKKS